MDENIGLARQFLLDNFVSRGMVTDFAVHQPDKEDGGISNPHFHVMCPIRPIEPDGKWCKKQRREYVLDEHIFQAKQEYGTIERGIYLAEIRKRQVALMPLSEKQKANATVSKHFGMM